MKYVWLVMLVIALPLVGCGGEPETPPKPAPAKKAKAAPAKNEAQPEAKAEETPAPAGLSLLITNSEFKQDSKGLYTVPDKAAMIILSPTEDGHFSLERVEDTESNVFHKALPYGDEGIMTLGGNKALLKLWTRDDEGVWVAEEIWAPTFGGKHNRLRDFEIADLDGDGSQDLAIATHDQGVVAFVTRRGKTWMPEELDRKADTFVHEIEIGDLDGDGKLEIYATPSEPNTATGTDQGGKIVRYAWNGEKFERAEVVALKTRHMKEILVADADDDGKQELYAAVEAETAGKEITAPVEIRRYDLVEGKFKESAVVSLDDRYCRFLVAGDLDGDGKTELVASAFSAGVWVIEKEGAEYKKTCIDKSSGGFEHASYIADLDEDGKPELYVADDRSGSIRRYTYADGKYTPKVINRRLIPSQAMIWNITTADLRKLFVEKTGENTPTDEEVAAEKPAAPAK